MRDTLVPYAGVGRTPQTTTSRHPLQPQQLRPWDMEEMVNLAKHRGKFPHRPHLRRPAHLAQESRKAQAQAQAQDTGTHQYMHRLDDNPVEVSL